ncbi:MAG: monovalent cation/H+ antiporter subunit D [Acinetobacter sp.]|nr:monovalent cation/H+ antiporter subunit D [Acinetobacter sp.]
MANLSAFWTFHAPILSILIPAFTGFLLVLLGNPGAGSLRVDWRQPWRRGISLLSATFSLVVAISYMLMVSNGEIFVYRLSEWSAPFGIVLVLDQLSALMIVLTNVLILPILWYASQKWDERGRYFHAMVHFLLMGVSGAFLTGDLFNLFVFFEILLMSSYVLLLHAQGKVRFQWGIHYVVINLFASALFLIGLGLIYASVGSLNMADVARLMPNLAPDQHRLAVAGGLLLFVVFGIKAAMFPVGFWLPKTYAIVATPVAAIFTIMTKVGVYAILRVNGTVFVDDVSQQLWQNALLIIGLIGSLYGVIGALGAVRLRRFVGFMVLSSVSTILIGLALVSSEAWAAALYYMVHSTLAAAALYLLCGWITSQRGDFKDHLKVSAQMKQEKAIAWCLFLLALIMAGLPPFSGFLGKVFLLQAAIGHDAQFWIFAIVLIVSLLSIIAFVRVGYVLIWQAERPEDNPNHEGFAHDQALPSKAPKANDSVIYILITVLLAYMAFASPSYQYTEQAAIMMKDHALYQQKVLHRAADGEVISTQPFDAKYVPHTKYQGEQADANAKFLPYILSPNTLQGDNISPEKQAQIQQQLGQTQGASNGK